MKRLENKVAIITGAAGGMGAAEAKLFAKEGASVFITDVQEEKLKAVVDQIQAEGGIAAYAVHDVSSEAEWKGVVDKAVASFGKIDILVNNAGITGKDAGPLEERTVEEYTRVLNVNLVGQFLGVKSVLPYMKKNGGGAIVNISSVASMIGVAGGNGYTSSKGGIRSFSKGAAVELAKHKIRVNSVYPGIIKTPMFESLGMDDNGSKGIESQTPLGRLGQPEEVANGVLFLATDEASFITGTELIIDGGLTAL